MARNKKDYYEVLGLSRDCSSSDIKQAYRKLARQFHPDVNNGDTEAEEKFKEISEAYAVLSNDEKRKQYDTYGFSGNLFDGINFDSVFSEFGFGDIFDMFFGNAFGGGFSSSRSRGRRQSRGSEVMSEVTIDFAEAAFGIKKDLEYNLDMDCQECSGKGSPTPEGIVTCKHCNGTGQLRISRDTFLGSIVTSSVCDVCRGSGILIKDPCKNCGGKGYLRGKKKITLEIPAGIGDRDQLRVSQKGNSLGSNSVPGDLIITVRVKPHPVLRREGNDVISVIEISFAQAALGAKINIITLDGREDINIKPGTQPGEKIILKSKGIVPINGSRRGEHIIFLNVKIPNDLNTEEVELLKKYAQGREEIVGDGPHRVFSNFKNAFKK